MEPERVKAEKTMLGTLITRAQKQSGLTDDETKRLKGFSALRAQCAHALVEGDLSDDKLADDVDGFLEWLAAATKKRGTL
jgi:hypothetical protein